MPFCPDCGTQGADEAAHCSNCGRALSPQPQYAAAQAGPYTPAPAAGYQQPAATYPGQRMGLPPYGINSLADPGQRLLARIIDWVLVGGVFIILMFVFLFPASVTVDTTNGELDGPVAGFFFGAFLLPFLALVLYEVVMIAIRGQTLGKMALGIKVVKSETGEIPGWGGSFIRWIVAGAIGLVPFGSLLDNLWLLWDENRQCIHDKAASTVVVRVR